MLNIEQDLFRFSTYIPQINLSFNQYLLKANEPVLVHTGDMQQASALMPGLKEKLAGVPLKYIFISHFEGDECGGLSLISDNFPESITICSEITARQLRGFGYKNEIITKKPGEKLSTSSYEFEFIGYPSEMHLWEGLVVVESHRGIFFSSDLMIHYGDAIVLDSSWAAEINNICWEQMPGHERFDQMQKTLTKFRPKLVATGHGPVLRLRYAPALP